MESKSRLSFAASDEDKAHIEAIRAHYGCSSNAAAIRRALQEHAKQIKEPAVKPSQPIRYSRRVY